MPRKILVTQRTKFWNLYQGGYSIREAAKRAGFSESYGKSLIRNGKLGPANSNAGPARIMREQEEEIRYRPKQRWELSPVALDCLDDFERFRARYLGSISVPWQVEAAYTVVDHLDSEDDSYGVINAPQGAGKTRLFSHDIPAWLTARDRTLRGCLGSGTMRISSGMCGNLRTTLARKERALASERWKLRGMACDAEATLLEDYGRFKPIMDGIMWTRDEFSVEQHWSGDQWTEDDQRVYRGAGQDKEATWAAFSFEAQVMSLRFDIMEWDDVHTWRQLRNPDGMQDLFTWWDTEAESRLDPGGLLLVTMQRLGANDISKYLLNKIDPEFEIDADRPDESPRQYFQVIFKAHYDDRCQGRHDREAPPYPEGCMLDPKRLTQQKISAKKVAGTYEVVFQQEDSDPASVLVQKDWVEQCWDDDRVIGELPHLPDGADYVRYLTVDPSPTKWWAIIDWVYVRPPDTERTAGYRYLIDLCRARMGANEFLDWSRNQDAYVGLAEDWVRRSKAQSNPIEWLVMERNAAQRWAMQYEFFRTWLHTRGVQLREHETTTNKSDPTYGIWATLPNVWRHGRVRLPGGDRASKLAVAPFVQEVTTYPDGATDDCVHSQWFGEYHLDSLIGSRVPVMGAFNSYMPSWMKEEVDTLPSSLERLVRKSA